MQDFDGRREFLISGVGAFAFTNEGGGKDSLPHTTETPPFLDIRSFGAKGDGLTDDSEAIQSALNAAQGRTVLVPANSRGFVVAKTISVPNGSSLAGVSAHASRLLASGTGPCMVVGSNTSIERLYLDGSRSSGAGLHFLGRDGQQTLQFVRITDFNQPCLYFEIQAGSGFNCVGSLIYRRSAAPGSRNFAICIEDKQQLRAVPRKFINLETGGQCSFQFGGSNSTYVANSFLADLEYSQNSAAVLITNSRLATTTPIDILGGQNSIVGCDIYPRVYLRERAGGCVVGPNSYNTGAVADLSGNSTNSVTFAELRGSFVLKLADAGVKNEVNAELRWSRQGSAVNARLSANLGGLPLNLAQLQLPLPQATHQVLEQPCGSVLIKQSSGARRLPLFCQPRSDVAQIENHAALPWPTLQLNSVVQIVAHYIYVV